MYLEEIDLCKRIREDNFKVYVLQNFKIKHIGASSSSIGEEFEKKIRLALVMVSILF